MSGAKNDLSEFRSKTRFDKLQLIIVLIYCDCEINNIRPCFIILVFSFFFEANVFIPLGSVNSKCKTPRDSYDFLENFKLECF